MALCQYENIHFQYSSGGVDEERWQGVCRNMKVNNSGTDLFRERFESDPGQWRRSFQNVVDEIIAEIESDRLSGPDSK